MKYTRLQFVTARPRFVKLRYPICRCTTVFRLNLRTYFFIAIALGFISAARSFIRAPHRASCRRKIDPARLSLTVVAAKSSKGSVSHLTSICSSMAARRGLDTSLFIRYLHCVFRVLQYHYSYYNYYVFPRLGGFFERKNKPLFRRAAILLEAST